MSLTPASGHLAWGELVALCSRMARSVASVVLLGLGGKTVRLLAESKSGLSDQQGSPSVGPRPARDDSSLDKVPVPAPRFLSTAAPLCASDALANMATASDAALDAALHRLVPACEFTGGPVPEELDGMLHRLSTLGYLIHQERYSGTLCILCCSHPPGLVLK